MKTRTIPLLTSLLLALSLILGDAERGIARTDAMPENPELTQLVICAEDGATTIMIDAAGNAVDPGKPCLRQHCTKCLVSVSGVLPLASAALPAPVVVRRLSTWSASIWSAARLEGHDYARGPPSESQIA
jgi:hypothetical protein